MVGIRRDEHGIRAKERLFSPRDSNRSAEIPEQDPARVEWRPRSEGD